ncbi:MAG: ABC transporter substrate-binding protein, partial [Patescibacteria group bacterium]
MVLRTLIRESARVLAKRHPSPFRSLEAWAHRLAPSDRLVVGLLGFLMLVSVGAMLAMTSMSVTSEVPARGGTYIEGVIGSPRFVNPLLAISETDRDLSTLVYAGLLKANTDGTFSPDLASSYAVSEDQLTYTFALRSDAVFHNGMPVTADDVAFTVREAQKPEVKSPVRANWDGVMVSVVDQRTVSFTLKAAYAPFLQNATLGILPSALWENVAPEEFPFSNLNTNPVGAGPYRIERVVENASGIPVEYRLGAFTEGTRVPYIEHIVMKFYPNADALTEALSARDIQAANSISPEAVAAPVIAAEAILGRVFGVFFNQNQNKVFTHAEVRAALAESLDKKAIIDIVLSGYGSVIDGPLPPESPETSTADERSADERAESARALLAKAGWTAGGDGVYIKKTKKETERLAFSLTTGNNPELKRAAEMVAEAWEKLGADVELRVFEENDLNVEVIRPRKYDALLFGLVVGDDVDLYAVWHSSHRNDPG